MFDVYNKEYENDFLRAENILYTKNNEDANDLLSQRRKVPKRKGETSSYNDITTLADFRQGLFSAGYTCNYIGICSFSGKIQFHDTITIVFFIVRNCIQVTNTIFALSYGCILALLRLYSGAKRMYLIVETSKTEKDAFEIIKNFK